MNFGVVEHKENWHDGLYNRRSEDGSSKICVNLWTNSGCIGALRSLLSSPEEAA
jgi:hypothetical protein